MDWRRNLIFVAACAVALLAAPAASAEWQTYLSDDFSSADTMFYTGPLGTAFYGISDDGRYVIDGMDSAGDSMAILTDNIYYYYLETECEVEDTLAGDLASCGVVFHYNKTTRPGQNSYYVFYIYSDGYYGVKRVIGDSDGRVDILIPLSSTEMIDPNYPNLLGVDCQGSRFDLYINGKYVDGFTDVRIDGGGVGLYASKQTRAAYDNFSVKVERRDQGKENVAQPDSARDPAAPQKSGYSFQGYSPPVIPRDPNRPVYPWEVDYVEPGSGQEQPPAEPPAGAEPEPGADEQPPAGTEPAPPVTPREPVQREEAAPAQPEPAPAPEPAAPELVQPKPEIAPAEPPVEPRPEVQQPEPAPEPPAEIKPQPEPEPEPGPATPDILIPPPPAEPEVAKPEPQLELAPKQESKPEIPAEPAVKPPSTATAIQQPPVDTPPAAPAEPQPEPEAQAPVEAPADTEVQPPAAPEQAPLKPATEPAPEPEPEPVIEPEPEPEAAAPAPEVPIEQPAARPPVEQPRPPAADVAPPSTPEAANQPEIMIPPPPAIEPEPEPEPEPQPQAAAPAEPAPAAAIPVPEPEPEPTPPATEPEHKPLKPTTGTPEPPAEPSPPADAIKLIEPETEVVIDDQRAAPPKEELVSQSFGDFNKPAEPEPAAPVDELQLPPAPAEPEAEPPVPEQPAAAPGPEPEDAELALAPKVSDSPPALELPHQQPELQPEPAAEPEPGPEVVPADEPQPVIEPEPAAPAADLPLFGNSNQQPEAPAEPAQPMPQPEIEIPVPPAVEPEPELPPSPPADEPPGEAITVSEDDFRKPWDGTQIKLEETHSDSEPWVSARPPAPKPQPEPEAEQPAPPSEQPAELKPLDIKPHEAAPQAAPAEEPQQTGADTEVVIADIPEPAPAPEPEPEPAPVEQPTAPAEPVTPPEEAVTPPAEPAVEPPAAPEAPADEPVAEAAGQPDETPGELYIPTRRSEPDELELLPPAGQPQLPEPAPQPPAVQPESAPRYSVTIIDDFSDETWPVADNGISAYAYDGNAYRIDNRQAETMAISFQANNLRQAEYIVDAEFIDGLTDAGFGLAGHFTASQGTASYYGLFISNTGDYLVLKVVNGRETVLKNWTPCNLLKANAPNQLMLEIDSPNIIVVLNGKEITRLLDSELKTGGYALLAGPGVEVRFDNLVVNGNQPK